MAAKLRRSGFLPKEEGAKWPKGPVRLEMTVSHNNLKAIQVNLHHAKAASDVLCRRFTKEVLDFALVQEPWVHNGTIKGLNLREGKLLYTKDHCRPRAAILIRNNKIKYLLITEHCSQDLVAIRAWIPTLRGEREVVLASAYLPGDSEEIPTRELVALQEYCQVHNLQWIVGCDVNAHHLVWGSTNTNTRGELLLEYFTIKNIIILNRGNEATFENAVRGEVLDLTFCSVSMSSVISNWHVSQETSMSDHKHIRFDMEVPTETHQTYRNPKKTNWQNFRACLDQEINCSTRPINSVYELEIEANSLQNNLITAFETSCPEKVKKSQRDVPWWNKKLEKLRRDSRKLYNSAKRNGEWNAYKAALTEYNKELRKSKRATWRSHCSKVCSLPDMYRLQKALSLDHSNGLGTLRRPDGSFTSSSNETGKLLLDTHFPGCVPFVERSCLPPAYTNAANGRARSLAGKIINCHTVQWAISTFSPYKSPGPDGIRPCLLQQGSGIILSTMVRIFRASLLMAHVPTNWSKVEVVFIPKPGKVNVHLPKSVRPISLSSFLIKTMEKLLDHFIRTECLRDHPLNNLQFAYQPGRSTVTAIHSLTITLEKAFSAKQIALCAFIDISGAFDNTSFVAIKTAMYQKAVPPLIVDWTLSMLRNRIISTSIGGSKQSITATRGCPQGGVLSPLLWTLVIDDLLNLLKDNGFVAQGYADDLVICVSGWHEDTISSRMQTALKLTTEWCKDKGLHINPEKTTVVPFTKRTKVNLKCPTLMGTDLTFSNEAKYLGVILDKRLNWNSQIENTVTKATKAFYACQRLFGKTWGISPRMTFWSFTTIVRPIITYAALAWWPKVKQRTAEQKLNKLHRLVCRGITGTIKTCPTDAMGVIVGIPPISLQIQKEAVASALRLNSVGSFRRGDLQGHLSILSEVFDDPYIKISDQIQRKVYFYRQFKVIIPERTDFENILHQIEKGSQVWYTDGSKLDNGCTGAGIFGPRFQKGLPMGRFPTVFQAELHAVEICVRECLHRRTKGANIHILTDSQAALLALKSYTINSGLVESCYNLLNELAGHNSVTLWWVPGHEGHEGNERADCLAKRGAQRCLVGPEPFCSLSKGHVKELLDNWEQKCFKTRWNNSKGQRQAKRFIIPNKNVSKRLLSLGREDIKTLTEYLTGHCKLRYHLRKMGLSETSDCRFCEKEDETSEHILCDCPALCSRRLIHLGEAFVAPCKIWNGLKPSQVLGYIKSLRMDLN